MGTLADFMTPCEPSVGEALETTETTDHPNQTGTNIGQACTLNRDCHKKAAEEDSSDEVSEEATLQVRSAEGQLLLRLLRAETKDAPPGVDTRRCTGVGGI